MKIFSKKSITIYTIIILILSMLIFEIGYCNSQIITTSGAEYNFSLCRIIIYTLPAILFFPFTFIKRDKRKSIFKAFLKCLNLQFLGYLIYQGLAVIFALDYLIGLEPFSNIAIFMSMFGYIATVSRNKNNDVEFGKINDNEF